MFKPKVVIVAQIVYSDYLGIIHPLEYGLDKIAAYEAGSTCYKNPHALIPFENVSCIHLVGDIVQARVISICYYSITH